MTNVNALIAFAVQADAGHYEPAPEEWGELVHFDRPALRPAPSYRPPADVVARACLALAEEYRDQAAALSEQGNADAARDQQAAARAATKAAYWAQEGPPVERWVGDVLLVRSSQGGGVVYRVSGAGCECDAAQHGRACWHEALFQAYEKVWAEMDAAEDMTTGYGIAAD